MLATNVLSFLSSENVLIFPSFMKDNFSQCKSLIDSIFLSALEKCYATSFCPPEFLIRNPLLLKLLFLIVKVFFLSHCFQDTLSLVFRNLTIMYLGVNFIGLISFEIYSASWTCHFIFKSVIMILVNTSMCVCMCARERDWERERKGGGSLLLIRGLIPLWGSHPQDLI